MIKAILFDLDGTLLDTSRGIIESVRHTVNRLGYEQLPVETIMKFVGPPIQKSLITHLGLTPEEAQNGANIFREYYKNNALLKASVFPGIKDVLVKLRNRGLKIGVATYKREDYAIDILKHFQLAEYFDIIHGADNENILTKADIIELCIRELKEDKTSVLLVGDTEHDARGAQVIGIGFIAVIWGFGYTSIDCTLEDPHVAIIDKPSDILNYLE